MYSLYIIKIDRQTHTERELLPLSCHRRLMHVCVRDMVVQYTVVGPSLMLMPQEARFSSSSSPLLSLLLLSVLLLLLRPLLLLPPPPPSLIMRHYRGFAAADAVT